MSCVLVGELATVHAVSITLEHVSVAGSGDNNVHTVSNKGKTLVKPAVATERTLVTICHTVSGTGCSVTLNEVDGVSCIRIGELAAEHAVSVTCEHIGVRRLNVSPADGALAAEAGIYVVVEVVPAVIAVVIAILVEVILGSGIEETTAVGALAILTGSPSAVLVAEACYEAAAVVALAILASRSVVVLAAVALDVGIALGAVTVLALSNAGVVLAVAVGLVTTKGTRNGSAVSSVLGTYALAGVEEPSGVNLPRSISVAEASAAVLTLPILFVTGLKTGSSNYSLKVLNVVRSRLDSAARANAVSLAREAYEVVNVNRNVTVEGSALTDLNCCGSRSLKVNVLVEETAGDLNEGRLAPSAAVCCDSEVESGGNVLKCCGAVYVCLSGGLKLAAGDSKLTVNGLVTGVLTPDCTVTLNKAAVNGNRVVVYGAVAEHTDCGGVVVVEVTAVYDKNSVAGGAVVIYNVLCMSGEVSDVELTTVDNESAAVRDGVVTLSVRSIVSANVVVEDLAGRAGILNGELTVVGDHSLAHCGALIRENEACKVDGSCSALLDNDRSIKSYVANEYDSLAVSCCKSCLESAVVGVADLSCNGSAILVGATDDSGCAGYVLGNNVLDGRNATEGTCYDTNARVAGYESNVLNGCAVKSLEADDTGDTTNHLVTGYSKAGNREVGVVGNEATVRLNVGDYATNGVTTGNVGACITYNGNVLCIYAASGVSKSCCGVVATLDCDIAANGDVLKSGVVRICDCSGNDVTAGLDSYVLDYEVLDEVLVVLINTLGNAEETCVYIAIGVECGIGDGEVLDLEAVTIEVTHEAVICVSGTDSYPVLACKIDVCHEVNSNALIVVSTDVYSITEGLELFKVVDEKNSRILINGVSAVAVVLNGVTKCAVAGIEFLIEGTAGNEAVSAGVDDTDELAAGNSDVSRGLGEEAKCIAALACLNLTTGDGEVSCVVIHVNLDSTLCTVYVTTGNVKGVLASRAVVELTDCHVVGRDDLTTGDGSSYVTKVAVGKKVNSVRVDGAAISLDGIVLNNTALNLENRACLRADGGNGNVICGIVGVSIDKSITVNDKSTAVGDHVLTCEVRSVGDSHTLVESESLACVNYESLIENDGLAGLCCSVSLLKGLVVVVTDLGGNSQVTNGTGVTCLAERPVVSECGNNSLCYLVVALGAVLTGGKTRLSTGCRNCSIGNHVVACCGNLGLCYLVVALGAVLAGGKTGSGTSGSYCSVSNDVVTGCGNDLLCYLHVASGAVRALGKTGFGTGGSYCRIGNHIMAECGNLGLLLLVITSGAMRACGEACLSTGCGRGLVDHEIVTKRKNNLLCNEDLVTYGTNLTVGKTVLIAGCRCACNSLLGVAESLSLGCTAIGTSLGSRAGCFCPVMLESGTARESRNGKDQKHSQD